MRSKKIRSISLIAFLPLLIGLQINSATWFRLKLAEYYEVNHRYGDAIKIYNKILTKASVKKVLDTEILSRIEIELGHLYANLNLINLAIESYAKGNAKLSDASLLSYRERLELNKAKLLAIGLLEAGRFDAAKSEFSRLERLYPQFKDVERYVDTAVALKAKNLKPQDEGFYFSIGDAYIQNLLFDEARAYFSRRILGYGVGPTDVLAYLQKRYAQDRGVRRAVWGEDIYVTLEDFEKIEPQLSVWFFNAEINDHSITCEDVYKGNYSESLDLTFHKKERGWWVKLVRVPLDDDRLKLGIRLFLKSREPLTPKVYSQVVFSNAGETGLQFNFNNRDIGGGWVESKSENLFESARSTAVTRGWSTEGMFIDKIVIDTMAVTNKFYVDDIELFIVNTES